MAVGLVFVSHSARIADGLVELAGQMAPSVRLVAAGGTDDGGIGTSYDRVLAGIAAADDGDGVLIIGDLGSALLTAETAVDLLEDPPSGGVRVLDAPIVEGGVAAAVAAESGAALDAVAAAALGTPPEQPSLSDDAAASVVLTDPEGLHARPAAALVRLAGGFDAHVTVDGADAASLLAILALGLRQGAEVTVRADGPQAAEARAAIVDLLRRAAG
ncbi:dihydroxyacetone kinase phosphoryl donor subunit DhaM [uncultured Amnibacterium sp.]|uniref:dihydroxyacetone kinase phosphoryl donor subunit DhaM n=1 Tax=uncultured Amnibacterium sp. TaxID=1631851 RepID=UPI0035CC8564